MTKRWKKNIFWKFIISYVLILLVLMTTMLVVSIHNLMQRQKESFLESERAMEQSIDNIENRFTEFSNLVQDISNDENLLKIQNGPENSFYFSYKLVQKLQNQAALNSLIDVIYVMLPEKDIIVGGDGIISGTEFFHRIRYDAKEDSYQSWLEGITSSRYKSGQVHMERVRIGSDEREVVLYSQPLTATISNIQYEGQVFFYVSESRLRSLVVNSGEVLEFNIGLCTGEKETIPLIAPEEEIEGRTFPFSKTSKSGKTYTCLFSENAILQDWYGQLLLNAGLIFLSLLVAIGLSVLFARRSSRPVAKIVTSLSDTPVEAFADKDSIYTFIQEGVAKLLDDRDALSQELERRIPLMQVGFIERLLNGTMIDYTDLEGQLENLRLSLTGNCYYVAILQITSYGSLEDDREGISALSMTLETLAQEYVGKNAIIYANEVSRLTIIFALPAMEEENRVSAICRSIMEQMGEQGIQMQAAVSAPYPSLADTFIAFSQAKRLLDSLHANESGTLLTYNSYHSQAIFYYFPTEIEIKLIRIMLSGNRSAVEEVFDELQRENMEVRKLTPAMTQRLVGELTGTYFKVLSLLDDAGVSTEILSSFCLHGDFDSDSDIAQVRAGFLELCEFIAAQRDQKGDKLRTHICEYLDKNFTDPNMNLAMLSAEFEVSEVYMSRLFKEQMATTFSQYLEKIRMNYALELLKNKKLSIIQVAEGCGYNSSHAFRRAFKRYWGYLPSEGRKE